MAYELTFAAALEREHAMCVALLHGPQSQALRHAFAAEREVTKIPGLPADTAVRDIVRAAVVGPASWGAASPCAWRMPAFPWP